MTIEWPGIECAMFLIALDNGGVNRDRPEQQVRREIRQWLAKQPADLLRLSVFRGWTALKTSPHADQPQRLKGLCRDSE